MLIHSTEVGLHPILLHVINSHFFFKQHTPYAPPVVSTAGGIRSPREREHMSFFSCSSDTLHVWNISTGESLTIKKLSVFLQCDNTQYITAGNPVIPKLRELLHLAPAPGTTAQAISYPQHLYTKDGHAPLTAHSLLCYLLCPVPLESALALQGTLIFNWIYLNWKTPHACKPLSY